MYAMQRLQEYMTRNATPATARQLSSFIEALKQEREFPLTGLYEVDYEAFELAVEVMREWRVDRYYAGRAEQIDSWMRPAEPA
jgi:hypothetical protein